MLGDLYRDHRQLDDFPGTVDPATNQVRPAIGTGLRHVLHAMGRCDAPRGEAVASLLCVLLLRWAAGGLNWIVGRAFGACAARFCLALQFGNPPSGNLIHEM